MHPSPVSPALRRIAVAIGVLQGLIGPLLFLLPDQTDRFFAWTIMPPLTAASLGVAYLSAVVTQVFVIRSPAWSRVRVAYPAMAAFTTLTTLATLLHLDKFHLNGPGLIPTLIAWAWPGVYIAVTILLWLAWVLQVRSRPVDEPRIQRLPGWFRAVLAAEGVLLVALGVVLFVAPDTAASLWPWPLTPLTARATAAWLVSFGLAAVFAVFEDAWERIGVVMAASVALGCLELVALVRDPGPVRWDQPIAAIYVAALAAIVAIGLYGWFAGREARAAP